MIKIDTDAWRKRLEELRSTLLSLHESAEDGRKAVDLDQTKVGRLSRIDAMQAQAMNKAIAGRRAQDLRRIDAALARLDDGEFGYCQDCGDPIAERRLDLDPMAVYCGRCAS